MPRQCSDNLATITTRERASGVQALELQWSPEVCQAVGKTVRPQERSADREIERSRERESERVDSRLNAATAI